MGRVKVTFEPYIRVLVGQIMGCEVVVQKILLPTVHHETLFTKHRSVISQHGVIVHHNQSTIDICYSPRVSGRFLLGCQLCRMKT